MNISEIAKMAGVSPAAVSRYLNDGYVSAEKKEQIRKVIEETGYKPSVQAQTLRTKKTHVIGVVLPKIDSEAISRIVAGISQQLSAAGYELLLANTENSIQKELEYLSVFENRRVDGIIFIATILTPKHKHLLKNLSIPVVIVGQKVDYLSCIYHDDYGASKALTTLMLRSGKKKIGYLGVTSKDEAAGTNRLKGYLDALADYPIKENASYQMHGDFTMESGYNNTRLLLEHHPDIDALFCATDLIAVGAMKYLKEQNYVIPKQISITGIGHTRMSEVISPALTTVHYYYKTSGIESADMLLELLKDPASPLRFVQLGYQLIKQESV